MNLPIYNLVDGEIDKMSLVLDPAVDINFMCFSKEKLKFNDEKQIITGVAMLADTPIYRNNYIYGEHYVVFTKDLIEKLVIKFFQNNKNSDVNIEHFQDVSGITIFESLIKNENHNLSFFSDIPNGSWVVSYKVENLDIYEKIKSGELKGFSIEGSFEYPDEDELYNEINKLI